MNRLKSLIDRIRYERACGRMRSLPSDAQRKAGLDLYTLVYDGYARRTGKNRGQVEVRFTCPYPSHVTHHALSALEARKRDTKDVLTDFECVQEGETYTLTCTVDTSVEESELVADACAMSAVLRIPTTEGDYQREAWRLA